MTIVLFQKNVLMSGRWKAGGGRWKVEGRRWKVEDRR